MNDHSGKKIMPVFKYKPFDEAERALWNFNPDDSYFKRVRNLEEANKQHDEWMLNHMISKEKNL